MSMGTSILGLMGNADPREALLRRIAAGMGQQPDSAQYAAQQDPAAATTTAQDQQPQRAPQPESLTTPEDLSSLYKDLLKYQSRSENIDRGIGLIGATFAHPENRANILNTFGGNGAGIDTNPEKMIGTVMELQKAEVGRQQMAAQMAALPGIAAKYGLDLPTAQLLLQSGELDKFIQEQEKPNNHTIKNENGQTDLVDFTKGEKLATFGELKTPVLKEAKDEVTGETILFGEDGKEVSRLGTEKNTDTLIDGPNGSKWLIDKDKKLKGSVLSADMSTTDTKEYDRYVADEAIRKPDSTPLTYQEWRMTKPASSQVNVNNAEETAFDKEMGKKFAEDYQNSQLAANSGRQMLAQYDLAEKALDSGLRTGFGAETEVALKKMAQAVGIDVDTSKLAGADLLSSVTNKMAMLARNPESGMGLPGSISDKDIDFLKKASVNFGASPTGNKDMIRAFRKLEERKIELGRMATAYMRKHKKIDAGFYEEVDNYANANPLFDDFKVGETLTPEQKKAATFKKYGL